MAGASRPLEACAAISEGGDEAGLRSIHTSSAAAMVFSREDIIDEILASKADALYDIGPALPPYIIHEPGGYIGQVCRHPLSKLIEIRPIFIQQRCASGGGCNISG
jgi:hypothetical protein